jgi:hypothetical protein
MTRIQVPENFMMSRQDYNEICEEQQAIGAIETLKSLQKKLWLLLSECENTPIDTADGKDAEDMNDYELSEFSEAFDFKQGQHYGIRRSIKALDDVIKEQDDLYFKHAKHCRFCSKEPLPTPYKGICNDIGSDEDSVEKMR